ncbi:MAG TPA: hypothetical protein VFX57_06410 [Sulfuricurvum sp.]|nr:hypothetical protein [Sulfuricurvum sp.]
MRPFIYLILFALAFILFKAFYLDSQKEAMTAEMNVSSDSNQSNNPTVMESAAPAVQPEENTSVPTEKKSAQVKEKMPLDELGDKIINVFD